MSQRESIFPCLVSQCQCISPLQTLTLQQELETKENDSANTKIAAVHPEAGGLPFALGNGNESVLFSKDECTCFGGFGGDINGMEKAFFYPPGILA